ncbi:MAG: hypothetical protein JSW26_03015 [Desulfobacterales bacterium]|nr:MAG: hypothetical protein JSW26_03015 [Desulfobacterales bacterium]
MHGYVLTHPRNAIANFFFWTSWAAATERPNMNVTYTNNWPHEPLVDNHPTAASLIWSLISIACLIAGVGALVWYKTFRDNDEDLPEPLKIDPLDEIETTPSMKAAEKYALIVIALFVLQVLLGALTAHYTVEGDSFFWDSPG